MDDWDPLAEKPGLDRVRVAGVDLQAGDRVRLWPLGRADILDLALEGKTATVDEIRDFCRGQIAHYKVPRYVRFVDAFPMTVTGKVQKFLMREESVAALGLEKAAAVKMA